MSDAIRQVAGTGTLDSLDKVRAVLTEPFKKQPNTNSLLVALEKIGMDGKRFAFKVKNQKCEWQVDRSFHATLKVGGTAPGTSTTIICTDAELVEEYAMLEYDGEQILVTARSGLTLTVIRDFGGQNGIRNIPAYAFITIQASRIVPEGSTNGARHALNTDWKYNYTERRRIGTGWTWDMLNNQDTYQNESRLQRQTRMIREALHEQSNRVLLTRDLPPQEIAASGTGNPSTTQPTHYTAGLPYYIRNNQLDMAGEPDFETINGLMGALAQEAGDDEFIWVCGHRVAQNLSKLGFQNPREMGYRNTEFGRELKNFFGDGWRAKVVVDFQMSRMGGLWGSAMYCLNLANIGIHNVREGMLLEEDTSTPGTDGKEIDLITQSAVIVGNPDAHGLIWRMAA